MSAAESSTRVCNKCALNGSGASGLADGHAIAGDADLHKAGRGARTRVNHNIATSSGAVRSLTQDVGGRTSGIAYSLSRTAHGVHTVVAQAKRARQRRRCRRRKPRLQSERRQTNWRRLLHRLRSMWQLAGAGNRHGVGDQSTLNCGGMGCVGDNNGTGGRANANGSRRGACASIDDNIIASLAGSTSLTHDIGALTSAGCDLLASDGVAGIAAELHGANQALLPPTATSPTDVRLFTEAAPLREGAGLQVRGNDCAIGSKGTAGQHIGCAHSGRCSDRPETDTPLELVMPAADTAPTAVI